MKEAATGHRAADLGRGPQLRAVPALRWRALSDNLRLREHLALLPESSGFDFGHGSSPRELEAYPHDEAKLNAPGSSVILGRHLSRQRHCTPSGDADATDNGRIFRFCGASRGIRPYAVDLSRQVAGQACHAWDASSAAHQPRDDRRSRGRRPRTDRPRGPPAHARRPAPARRAGPRQRSRSRSRAGVCLRARGMRRRLDRSPNPIRLPRRCHGRGIQSGSIRPRLGAGRVVATRQSRGAPDDLDRPGISSTRARAILRSSVYVDQHRSAVARSRHRQGARHHHRHRRASQA